MVFEVGGKRPGYFVSVLVNLYTASEIFIIHLGLLENFCDQAQHEKLITKLKALPIEGTYIYRWLQC